MENLRKVISLHRASQISGYHQDYLSSLIRKNEIKGEKVGRNWCTTEEEIKGYMLKQEIRHKKSILKYLLYFKRINKSFVSAFICLAIFSVGIYFYNKESHNQIATQTIHTQFPQINQPEVKDTLQF